MADNVEPKKDDVKKDETVKVVKPAETAPTPPKPAVTPAPTTKPAPQPTAKSPEVSSRIKQQIELYMTEAKSTKDNKVPAVRLYDLIAALKKDVTDTNMEAVTDIFRKNRTTILNDYNALKGADKLKDIKKSAMVGIFYTLCIELVDPSKTNTKYSAARCKEFLGEDMFLWFNKKFPKKTFVN